MSHAQADPAAATGSGADEGVGQAQRTAAVETDEGKATEPALLAALQTLHDSLGRSCQPQQIAHSGALRFVACGAAGLWTLRMSGDTVSLLHAQDLGGNVTGFFSANGRLWVEIRSVRAQELTLPGSAPTVSPSAPIELAPAVALPAVTSDARSAVPAVRNTDTPPVIEGRIVAREDETLMLDMQGQRPKPGSHIAFIGPDPKHPRLNEDVVFAVSEVIGSSPSWVRVAIGTNEEIPDAKARFTSAPVTRSTFAPPRAAGIWELGFLARPFLVLDDLGAGAMLDAQVGYRGHGPFHVQAALAPLAFATARAGALATVGAFVSGAYDARLFEVGLGLGGQTVNDPSFGLDPGSGLLVSQLLRLGARDGAHLMFRSYVALFHSVFEFSSLRVDGQIPLGGRTWLRLAGGGGTMGLGYGEVGLRVLTAGNGGRGSIFLTASIGWVGLYKSCNQVAASTTDTGFCESTSYDGPMLGAGLEFRL